MKHSATSITQKSQTKKHLTIATASIALLSVALGLTFDLGNLAIAGGLAFIAVHLLLAIAGSGAVLLFRNRLNKP